MWFPFALQDPVTEARIRTVEQMERLVLQAIRIAKMNAVSITE